MVWHTSQGNAGPNQCQTNNSHRCLWLCHQGGSSSSMQRRQRGPLKPSGILMLYSHRQHHLHCAQRQLVHMIVKGLACRMRKNVALIQQRARGCAEAARESSGCQLVGAHANLDTKLLVSQMAKSENAKRSKIDRQKRTRGHGHW